MSTAFFSPTRRRLVKSNSRLPYLWVAIEVLPRLHLSTTTASQGCSVGRSFPVSFLFDGFTLLEQYTPPSSLDIHLRVAGRLGTEVGEMMIRNLCFFESFSRVHILLC